MSKSIANVLRELGVQPDPEAKATLYAWGQQRFQDGLNEAAKRSGTAQPIHPSHELYPLMGESDQGRRWCTICTGCTCHNDLTQPCEEA